MHWKLPSQVLKFADRFAAGWCALVHTSILWPIVGHYRCAVCLRSFPVVWERPPIDHRTVTVSAPARHD